MSIVRSSASVWVALASVIVAGVARAEEKPESAAVAAAASAPPATIRVGLIGCDTSHAIAFTELINAKEPAPELAGLRVVAAFPQASPDFKPSISRVEGYTKQLRDGGVEIVDSIPALLDKVDAVMIESVDGRPHLEQARPVFAAGKRVFIDKPLTASLADGIAVAELAKRHGVPWFSASALRFTPAVANAANDPKVGKVVGCLAWSPGMIDPTHPDLFWYGIHGVETLFTVMGPGCTSVARTHTPDADVVTGVWQDGRVGTFRGIRGAGKKDFGLTVFGTKAITSTPDAFKGYPPLVAEIAKFFRTGKPPIAPEQTLEILAFMEAADESKRQGGAPVTIDSVMERAKAEAAKRMAPPTR